MSAKNRITEIRKKLGITQYELAERTNTSAPQIQRLESGKRRLTIDWMERISKALECNPADLLISTSLPTEEQALLDKFRVMKPHQQETFLKVADAMADEKRSSYEHDDTE